MILGACAYDTHFDDCAVRCSTDAECPVGLTCRTEGLCRTLDEAETCAKVLDTFPSCVGLAETCGPNADEDCCSTATSIPGGTFFRSYDVAGDGMYPSTSYPATVSPFRLDRFEVTVGRFRKFVEAGMGTHVNPPMDGAGTHPNLARSGWDPIWNSELVSDTPALVAGIKCDSTTTWTDAPGVKEDLPINCTTWYEVMAFCIWDDAYLPTEAEWNYAAAAGSEHRVYPWSNPPNSKEIDCSYTNYHNGTTTCVLNGATNRVGSESPKGDGKWGQADLSGNLWERTLDWHAAQYANTNQCDDCADLSPAVVRVDRGGYFRSPASELRGAMRGTVPPSFRRSSIGARCARPDR